MLEYSFTQLGIDLESVWRTRSWRWFTTHIRGMLADENSALHKHFRTDDSPTEA